MSDIHYFQRYSQRENVVTNNTLLFLSRIYHYSPASFEKLFRSVLDDIDVSIGPSFAQQKGGRSSDGSGSIPDGMITQPSFRVAIETKLYDNADADQLIRHLDRFQNADIRVLLLVAPSDPPKGLVAHVEQAIKERPGKPGGSVVFRTLTFSKLIGTVREEEIIPPHEGELNEMVDDFEAFCIGAHLIPSAPHMMRVVLCGNTLEENVEHGVYYHPATRGYSKLGYLGLYKDKSVRAVGKLVNTVRATVGEDGHLRLDDWDTEPTEEEKSRIVGAAQAGHANHGYEFGEDRLYFLVDRFFRTDESGGGFQKTSKYGLPGEKHFDLHDVLRVKTLPSTEEIAKALSTESWA